jgi:glycosyltransferase involved in cell wall biosynthesis
MNLDVVVCAKNRAETLRQVLPQIISKVPFKNLIVVYGTSTDGTEYIARKYTPNVFWDEDKGLGAARNLGIRKASSEIVAMIDTDVLLTDNWASQLLVHFDDPQVAAVIGTCIYGYGCKPLESYWRYLQKTDINNWGCHNTMFRRELILKAGNFDACIRGAGEDYDLYLRLLSAGYKWIWERDAVVYHPMGMFEYLEHLRWWAQGNPYVNSAQRWVIRTSLFRAYGRQGIYFLKSFREALKLAREVHPTFLLYWPIVRLVQISETLKSLKTASVCRVEK